MLSTARTPSLLLMTSEAGNSLPRKHSAITWLQPCMTGRAVCSYDIDPGSGFCTLVSYVHLKFNKSLFPACKAIFNVVRWISAELCFLVHNQSCYVFEIRRKFWTWWDKMDILAFEFYLFKFFIISTLTLVFTWRGVTSTTFLLPFRNHWELAETLWYLFYKIFSQNNSWSATLRKANF